MKAKWIAFGEVEIEGRRYTSDVVIEAGRVKKRRKEPSKRYRDEYGHTPLSAEERIPWGGSQLIVGTGASWQPADHARRPCRGGPPRHRDRRHAYQGGTARCCVTSRSRTSTPSST